MPTTTTKPTPLPIRVARATGSGPTGLAAFDASLRNAGAANYNLVRLSSVIPAASLVGEVPAPIHVDGEWGDRLYTVYAEWRASEPGQEAWAGVGWVQDPVTGRGLLVEHEGNVEVKVRADISASLGALRAGRDVDFGPDHVVVQGAVCRDEPVCALVIAVFEHETWRRDGVVG